MTVGFIDGFDDWVDWSQQLWTRSSTSISISRPGRFGYGGCLSFGIHNANCIRTVTADSRYTFAMGFRPHSISTSGTLFRLMEGTTVHGTVNYNTGQFQVVSGATWNADSVTITSDVWYHLEIDYTVHDSTGAVTLKLNGNTILNVSGVDTRNSGSGVIDQIQFISPNVTNHHADWDDMVALKGGGSVGDVRVITDYPIADGANTAWGATTASTIAWVGNGSLASNSGANTISWPGSGYAVGDIGFLYIETVGLETPTTPPSYWELVGTASTGTGTGGTRMTVYWTRATSTSMPSVSQNDVGDHTIGQIVVISGAAKVGSPIDDVVTGSKGSASTSLTIDGPVTTQAGDMVLLFVSSDLDSAAAFASAWTNANLDSLTERYDFGATDGNGGQIAVASGIKAAAGDVGDTTLTVTSSVNAYVAVAVKSQTTSDYDTVNDMINTGDTDYLSTTTAGDRSTFEFTDIGITGTVHSLAISHISRKDDAGGRKVVTSIRRSSTDYDNATTQDLGDTYAHQQQIYEQDPSTSAAWTVSGVNAGEFGLKLDT